MSAFVEVAQSDREYEATVWYGPLFPMSSPGEFIRWRGKIREGRRPGRPSMLVAEVDSRWRWLCIRRCKKIMRRLNQGARLVTDATALYERIAELEREVGIGQ